MNTVAKESTSTTRAVKAAATTASAPKRPPISLEEGFVLISRHLLAVEGLPLDHDLVERYVLDEGLDLTNKRLKTELIHRVRNLKEDANTVLAELAARPHRHHGIGQASRRG